MDDDRPNPKPAMLPLQVLDRWDVGELHEYIAALRAEITRAEAEIGRKQAHKSAADSFFRTGRT